MEVFYLVVFGAIVLLAPMISTDQLLWLDHIVVRIVIIGWLYYLVKLNRMLGLFGLLGIAVLYIERNRRKVDRAAKKLEQMDSEKPIMATVEEATTPQQTVPVRPFDVPDENEFDFLPKEDSFTDLNFDPVAPSINYKSTLATVYPYGGSPSPSSAEELFEEMGVGHVPGVTTLGNE